MTSNSSIKLKGETRSFAIGEMNNSFKPNQVIETFESMGVDLAFMASESNSQRVYVVTHDEDLFFDVGDVFSNSDIKLKMTMNDRILVVNSSLDEVLNALMEAE